MALRLEDIGEVVDKLALACIEFLRSNPEAYKLIADELGCTINELEAVHTLVSQLRQEENDAEWNKACAEHGLEDWADDITHDETLNDPIHWNPPLLAVKLH